MHGATEFLTALTTVLCVAGLITVTFQRLKQPVVLGYLLAGLVVGPHLPIPLVADLEIVQTLSELGVILLMFSLGLEFSLRRLLQVGPSAVITAGVQCSVLIWLGIAVGEAMGWTTREGLFAGAMIAISSTTIIAKAFDEQRVGGRLRELVVGVLIVEDLIAVLLLAVLPSLAGGGFSAMLLARAGARLAGLLAGILALGLLVVPRAMRAVVRLERAETTLVASVGICFAFALLAHKLGYSVALGAFLAGSLIAESGEEKTVEHLVQPVRDVFAAVFFVSVGMLFDPKVIVQHGSAVALMTLAVLIGNVVGVSLGAFLTGNGIRISLQAGMSLAQIGEFSFIIAALGTSTGATGNFLYPVAVAVSALTTLTTPWLIRGSAGAAAFVDRKLPHRLQTFAALYGSWVERLRGAEGRKTQGRTLRRLAGLLALDAALLAALAIGVSIAGGDVMRSLESIGLAPVAGRALVAGGTIALAAPLVFGLVRVARRVGVTLARVAFPQVDGAGLDLAAAPRRALVMTLQAAVVGAVGLVVLAFTQPFVPARGSAFVLSVLVALLGLGFWRSTRDLEGHVRAGAAAILEALTRERSAPARERPLRDVSQLLPGLGEPTPVQIPERSAARGRTLAELDLRGLTGATVLAITRANGSVALPGPREALAVGDVVALAGSHEAVIAAKALLEAPKSEEGLGGN
jgi:CPA2 family monovalent cation:H+ antiporter-2